MNAQAMKKASSGRTTSCPVIPANTALGYFATLLKASKSSPIPSRNISRIRIGITIHIVCIACNF